MKRGGWVLAGALLLMTLAAACGSSSGASSDGPTPGADASTATELEAILATTQLRPGPQRVAFLLLAEDSFLKAPEVTVSSVYLPADGSEPRTGETATARFHLWPYGVRASYVTDLTFDRPGSWRLDIGVDYGVGFSGTAQLLLDVQERVGVQRCGRIDDATLAVRSVVPEQIVGRDGSAVDILEA